MKLLRYGAPEQEKPGTLDAQGQIRDLSKIVPDITGGTISLESIARRRAVDPATLPLYLKPGNRMRLGVDGLGEQNQNVVAEST